MPVTPSLIFTLFIFPAFSIRQMVATEQDNRADAALTRIVADSGRRSKLLMLETYFVSMAYYSFWFAICPLQMQRWIRIICRPLVTPPSGIERQLFVAGRSQNLTLSIAS